MVRASPRAGAATEHCPEGTLSRRNLSALTAEPSTSGRVVRPVDTDALGIGPGCRSSPSEATGGGLLRARRRPHLRYSEVAAQVGETNSWVTKRLSALRRELERMYGGGCTRGGVAPPAFPTRRLKRASKMVATGPAARTPGRKPESHRRALGTRGEELKANRVQTCGASSFAWQDTRPRPVVCFGPPSQTPSIRCRPSLTAQG
jgi:hypothetical protein